MFDDIKEIIQSYPALAVIVMYFWVKGALKALRLSVSGIKNIVTKENEDIKLEVMKEVEKMESLTERGIKSGEDSRKELWIEVRHLSDRLSKIEGRLNGSNK